MEGMKRLELGTLNNGAATELFDREMKEIMENIEDVSTDPTEPRKITLEFIFTPNNSREMGVLEIKAKSKLASAQSTGSTFIMKNNGKVTVPWEPDYHQGAFGFESKNVRVIDRKSAAAGDKND